MNEAAAKDPPPSKMAPSAVPPKTENGAFPDSNAGDNTLARDCDALKQHTPAAATPFSLSDFFCSEEFPPKPSTSPTEAEDAFAPTVFTADSDMVETEPQETSKLQSVGTDSATPL